MPDKYYAIFTKKRLAIRGVGENELVWIVKDEFDRLPDKAKVLFHEPDGLNAEVPNLSPSPLYSLKLS